MVLSNCGINLIYTETSFHLLVRVNRLCSFEENILREKSLAIYFEDSQFRRNRTFNFILSNIYVDKRSQIR